MGKKTFLGVYVCASVCACVHVYACVCSMCLHTHSILGGFRCKCEKVGVILNDNLEDLGKKINLWI